MTPDALDPDSHASGLTQEAINASRYDGHEDHALEVAGKLRAMMPLGVRVLDVGCGTGSVTLIVNSSGGNTIVAIEPDPERAAVARSRGLTVHEGTLDDEFIADQGPFDVVMSSDVLEHIAAPAEFLSSMIKAVKPGGLILLSVPNIAHWSVRLNLLRGRFDYEPVGIMDATHLRWFTAKTIRSLLEHNGLTVLEMSQTAGYTLPSYHRGWLGRLPAKVRNVLITTGTHLFPLLFGVQHVVKARVDLPNESHAII